MRLAILILPVLLAAGPALADQDRHHRSVPRIKAEIRTEAPIAQPQSRTQPAVRTADLTAEKPEARRPVRVVLPSPYAP